MHNARRISRVMHRSTRLNKRQKSPHLTNNELIEPRELIAALQRCILGTFADDAGRVAVGNLRVWKAVIGLPFRKGGFNVGHDGFRCDSRRSSWLTI
jgi:hypothetical protein